MRTTDDARRDPIPGDTFQKGRTFRRVIRIDRDWAGRTCVVYLTRNGANQWSGRENFVKWAADADVLEVAQ